jgi:DNA-binding YbaB/EbfC family protein
MNIQEMLRQAERMKKKIEAVREEAGQRTVEGSAGGGMVVVVATGRGQIQSVRIEKQVVDPEELEMLQDLIVAATNQALTRASEMMQAELSKATGGQLPPGLF